MNTKETISTEQEAERIKSLKTYELLDTPGDERLDRITSYAALLFGVPISLISLVDEDRIWFKSTHGFAGREMPREAGLCGYAIQSNEVFVIENAALDPRTMNLPWVKHMKPYCFYAGAPLRMSDGHNLGTLCIVDEKPRIFSNKEKQLLKNLAQIAVDQIEEQVTLKANAKKFTILLKTAAHELKNPLTSIPLWAEIIHEESADLKLKQLATHIQRQSKRMVQLINELLEPVHSNATETVLKQNPINFSSVVARVTSANIELANKKQQQIFLTIENDIHIAGDELKISEVVENLISNAIKYSNTNTAVTVHLKEENKKAVLQISDQGPGLTEEDFPKLFLPFSTLSARPTAGEPSTGLGLSIVKQIIEAHNGTVSCRNNLPDPGASFIVELSCLASRTE